MISSYLRPRSRTRRLRRSRSTTLSSSGDGRSCPVSILHIPLGYSSYFSLRRVRADPGPHSRGRGEAEQAIEPRSVAREEDRLCALSNARTRAHVPYDEGEGVQRGGGPVPTLPVEPLRDARGGRVRADQERHHRVPRLPLRLVLQEPQPAGAPAPVYDAARHDREGGGRGGEGGGGGAAEDFREPGQGEHGGPRLAQFKVTDEPVQKRTAEEVKKEDKAPVASAASTTGSGRTRAPKKKKT